MSVFSLMKINNTLPPLWLCKVENIKKIDSNLLFSKSTGKFLIMMVNLKLN